MKKKAKHLRKKQLLKKIGEAIGMILFSSFWAIFFIAGF